MTRKLIFSSILAMIAVVMTSCWEIPEPDVVFKEADLLGLWQEEGAEAYVRFTDEMDESGEYKYGREWDEAEDVLESIYLGVNVSGRLDDLDIKLAPCKFAKDFKPLFRKKVDAQSAELRSMIRESMRKNVKM